MPIWVNENTGEMTTNHKKALKWLKAAAIVTLYLYYIKQNKLVNCGEV